MRICGSRIATGLLALLLAAPVIPGSAEGQVASYLDFDGLTQELRSLVNGSDLAQMESLGETLQGREIWLVTVGNSSGAPHSERPGVLVVGNLEGDHLAGSHLSLEAIRYLIENADDPGVREALDDQVFYFFPRLNPDGAEAMFQRVKWNRRTNSKPRDDDNDGRVDEDGPEDLNGDGYITVMRVQDPAGAYMPDPSDPRLMKRADATEGEQGSYTLYWEGTDEDGDGFINEDGPGGVDLNRNFQHEYPYWEADAGKYMVSEVESRALMDFVLEHGNIAAILTFGETDNLVTPPDSRGELASPKVLDLTTFADASNEGVFDVGAFGSGGGGFSRGFGFRGGGGWLRGAQPGRDNDPGSGTRPATTVTPNDRVYFETVSDAYKEITGIETVPVHRAPEGAFFEYGYFHYGVLSFSTPGWGLPEVEDQESGSPGPQADAPEEPSARPRVPPAAGGSRAERLAALRGAMAGQSRPAGGGSAGSDVQILQALEAGGIDAFAEWSTFRHPELGEVEIGGFLPYVTHNPPAGDLPELGAKHGQFLVALAGMLPRVRIADTEVTAHGGGLFTVEVEVENVGFFPTSTRHGVRSRSVGPTLLQPQVSDDDILTGADKTVRLGVLNGSGDRETVTWLIQGREGSQVEVKLLSAKSGHYTSTVTLR